MANNFLKEFNYSISQKEIEYQEIKNNFQSDIYKTRDDLIKLVREKQKEVLKLNVKIYKKIQEIDNEIYKIDKSFI